MRINYSLLPHLRINYSILPQIRLNYSLLSHLRINHYLLPHLRINYYLLPHMNINYLLWLWKWIYFRPSNREDEHVLCVIKVFIYKMSLCFKFAFILVSEISAQSDMSFILLKNYYILLSKKVNWKFNWKQSLKKWMLVNNLKKCVVCTPKLKDKYIRSKISAISIWW